MKSARVAQWDLFAPTPRAPQLDPINRAKALDLLQAMLLEAVAGPVEKAPDQQEAGND